MQIQLWFNGKHSLSLNCVCISVVDLETSLSLQTTLSPISEAFFQLGLVWVLYFFDPDNIQPTL